MLFVGLPKGLFYYQDQILWKEFLTRLGCQVIVSENTNNEIINNGVKYCTNETCLPIKVFHGHVYSLKDQVDYILIPRYTSIDKNEYCCPKFCGLPDMTLLNLKNQIQILEVKIHMDHSPEITYESLRNIAITLNIEPLSAIEAFKTAYDLSQKQYRLDLKTKTNKNSAKPSISVLGHPYMIYDDFISMKLIDKLIRKNYNVYTPYDVKHEDKRRNAYPFQSKVFWEVGFENLGTAFTLAKHSDAKGFIYVTPFACGVDAFVIDFIERRLQSHYNKPFLKLTIDEHTGEAGFDTRVEAFLDMIG